MSFYCSDCEEGITKKVYNYSIKHYNRALCRKHQKEHSKNNSSGLSDRDSQF